MNGLSMRNDTALSAHYYTDPGQFDIDLNKIFYRTWQCVCHVSEIEQTGDYVTHSVAGEDVFVIRLKNTCLDIHGSQIMISSQNYGKGASNK